NNAFATVDDILELLNSRSILDKDSFLNFPWGRESYLRTLVHLRPGKRISAKCSDPIHTFCEKLKSGSMCLKGFPLILQLLAFNNISSHFRCKAYSHSNSRGSFAKTTTYSNG
ncbi:unnamed protein product, partial [Thlaspi arvense]